MNRKRLDSSRIPFMRSVLEGVGFTLLFAIVIATTEIGNRLVEDATAQSTPPEFNAISALALSAADDVGLATGPITEVAASLNDVPPLSTIPREFELRGPLLPDQDANTHPTPAHSGERYYALNTQTEF